MLFDLLYDKDIIREDVFWKWKSEVREDDHAISALSLKGFYDSLNEADNDAEAEIAQYGASAHVIKSRTVVWLNQSTRSNR